MFQILYHNFIVQNQKEHHKIFTNFVAVHQTVVSENCSFSGMLIMLTKSDHKNNQSTESTAGRAYMQIYNGW